MNETRIIRGRRVVFEREPPRGPVESLRVFFDAESQPKPNGRINPRMLALLGREVTRA